MKKSILIILCTFFVISSIAQKGKVTGALNLKETGKLEKALETIELAVDETNPKAEKSIVWPKTWEVRGEIYQAIFNSKDDKIKKLCNHPLNIAFESYKKALELDEKGKFAKSTKIKLTLLTNDFSIQAGKAYETQDFETSLASFERILLINSMDIFKADNLGIDSAIVFNAGIAAFNAKKFDIASKYYEESAQLGYNGAKTYTLWATALKMNNDSTGAQDALKEGFSKYPEDNDILLSLIQNYLDFGKNQDAIVYLDKAIAQEPTNPLLYRVKGSVLEELKEYEKSIEMYTKAIENDATYFDAYYNLGVIYYNKGVNQWQAAIDIPANQNEKYNSELKKADSWFLKSLPYMEKCKQINPSDRNALESLKNIYYRLIANDKEKYEPKYAKINALLKQ